jgi:hypothetical protein
MISSKVVPVPLAPLSGARIAKAFIASAYGLYEGLSKA